MSSHPSLDDPNAWVTYRYYPNVAAAAIFIALYSIVTIIHIGLIAVRRTWFFTPFIIGGICKWLSLYPNGNVNLLIWAVEIVGYIGRLLSHDDLWALGPYIMQSLLLLLAPALFAASIYIVLGRIIVSVDGERYSLVPIRWLTKVFVTGDIISFLVQMAGGGIQAAGTLDLLNPGEKIIVAGLFCQIAFFGIFIVVAIIFHYRFSRSPATNTLAHSIWKKHLYALYLGSGIIMVRSIFRVVEYLMGNNGYLLRHEVFLYIFDATLMFIVMVLFLIIHPSELVAVDAIQQSQHAADISMSETSSNKHETYGRI